MSGVSARTAATSGRPCTMKPAMVAAALTLALSGCGAGGADADSPTSTSSTSSTEPDPTKVTFGSVAIDRDNWNDRFGLEHQQWLDPLVYIKADDDDSTYRIETSFRRPEQTQKAMEMCEDFKAMVESEGHDSPHIEVYGDGGVLLTRVGYSATRDHCLRL